MENAASGFECDTLDEDRSAEAVDRYWSSPPASATVVMWTDVKSFPQIAHGNSIDRFLDDLSTRLRHHLGLVFHRIVAAGSVVIGIDVEDVGIEDTGLRFSVEPIDPFGYVAYLSAMALHGLTDRIPQTLMVATPAPKDWQAHAQARMQRDLGEDLDPYEAAGFPRLQTVKFERLMGMPVQITTRRSSEPMPWPWRITGAAIRCGSLSYMRAAMYMASSSYTT